MLCALYFFLYIIFLVTAALSIVASNSTATTPSFELLFRFHKFLSLGRSIYIDLLRFKVVAITAPFGCQWAVNFKGLLTLSLSLSLLLTAGSAADSLEEGDSTGSGKNKSGSKGGLLACGKASSFASAAVAAMAMKLTSASASASAFARSDSDLIARDAHANDHSVARAATGARDTTDSSSSRVGSSKKISTAVYDDTELDTSDIDILIDGHPEYGVVCSSLAYRQSYKC